MGEGQKGERLNNTVGRHPRGIQLRAIVMACVGLAVASLAAGVLSLGVGTTHASAQFDDEREPGTCVLSEVVATELSQGQCDALTAVYWATRGPDWDKQRGWATATDPCTWGGVTCAPGNGHAVVRQLVIHDNGLSGYLPEQVEGLRWIEKLQLSGNDIGGVIPVQIGLLQQLRVLDLSGNRLTGEVPDRIGDLTHLRVLNLSDNALTGYVPQPISELGQLVQLQLDRNDCLVLRILTQRALNELVEGSFHDHCARAEVASSCLAGNGRIDVDIRNESAVVQTYTVTVGSLAPRHRTIAAGAQSRVSVTGRPEGPLGIIVRHQDVDLRAAEVIVDCDPDLTAVGASRCVQDGGRLDVEVTNQTASDERVWVAVDDLSVRSAVVPANAAHTVTIAVADGERIVRVNSRAMQLEPFTTQVSCS